jgi:Yip1 domain
MENNSMDTAAIPTPAAAPIIGRIKNVLITPRTEWPVIRSERSTVQSIYTGYLCLIGLVPALAGFIGLSLVGIGGFGVSFRVPILTGLVNMVVGYALWLASAWLLAHVVNAVAPTFGGQKDFLAAFKVVAYSFTAAWLGGVVSVVPALSILGLLAALYSIYLLYVGLPVLMQCPPAKALGYTALTVLGGIVIGIVIALISALLIPHGGMMPGGGAISSANGSAGDISIKTPQGEVKIDQSKMEAFAQKMEQAAKAMEQAGKTGDVGAVAQAATAMASAAAASTGRTPIDSQALKAMLPSAAAGLARTTWEAQGNEAAGVSMSSARAEYGDAKQRITLSINDTGGLAGLAGIATALNLSVDKQTPDGSERVYRQGQRTVREQTDKRSERTELSVMMPNGVMVEAEGSGVDLPALKSVVDALPLANLESAGR